MPDLSDISIKLKKQGKTACFGIGILHKNLIGIRFFFQNICTECLRDHSKLQIAVISLIVVDHIIFNAICVERLRFSCRVHADGYRTRHSHRSSKCHFAFLCNCDLGIMHITDIKFYFVFLIGHPLNLHLIKDLVQLLTVDPHLRFRIKNGGCVQGILHFLFCIQILFICI